MLHAVRPIFFYPWGIDNVLSRGGLPFFLGLKVVFSAFLWGFGPFGGAPRARIAFWDMLRALVVARLIGHAPNWFCKRNGSHDLHLLDQLGCRDLGRYHEAFV